MDSLRVNLTNALDPDQDRCSVGPKLDQNCLQRLSADDKIAAIKEIVKPLLHNTVF